MEKLSYETAKLIRRVIKDFYMPDVIAFVDNCFDQPVSDALENTTTAYKNRLREELPSDPTNPYQSKIRDIYYPNRRNEPVHIVVDDNTSMIHINSSSKQALIDVKKTLFEFGNILIKSNLSFSKSLLV
jgi:hypothetical protein